MNFIILGLAVWRLSSLIAREEGPMQILDRFRYFAGVRYADDGVYFLNNFAKGISCPACLSVWIGAIASVAYLLFNSSIVYTGVVWALALSAIAVIVDEITN